MALTQQNCPDGDQDDSTIYTTQEGEKKSTGFLKSLDDPLFLDEVYAFPNPVRPGFTGNVTIDGLTADANVKITDIEGNLVAEAQSNINLRYKNYNLEIDGGTAYWNGKNLANNTVASGVYLVLFSDFNTLETKVSKIMIIR